LRLVPAALLIGLITLALPSAARAQSDGAKTFKTNCTQCHGEDGSGNTPIGKALKAKDLRSDEVQKKSDAELTDVITKGRGNMPAWGSKLSAVEIKSLVAYIRQIPKK
jgi:mono/diheme cytochrome c family protein